MNEKVIAFTLQKESFHMMKTRFKFSRTQETHMLMIITGYKVSLIQRLSIQLIIDQIPECPWGLSRDMCLPLETQDRFQMCNPSFKVIDNVGRLVHIRMLMKSL